MTGDGEAAGVSVRALCWALLRSDETIQLSEVAEIGAALGLTEQQVRHGVRRLCDREGFVREGRGRHAIARLDNAGSDLWRLDRELVQFAFRQDAGNEPWDGRWRLVVFSVPEARRADRDRLRSWLREMGGAAISQASYVSPHDWWPVVEPLVHDLELMAHVSWGELDRLEVGGRHEPAAIAHHLWPPDDRDAAYRAALEHIDGALRSWGDLDDVTRRRVWVDASVRLIEPLEHDPLLPPELAQGWGRPARRAYRELSERFLADVEGAHRYSVAVEMTRPV